MNRRYLAAVTVLMLFVLLLPSFIAVVRAGEVIPLSPSPWQKGYRTMQWNGYSIIKSNILLYNMYMGPYWLGNVVGFTSDAGQWHTFELVQDSSGLKAGWEPDYPAGIRIIATGLTFGRYYEFTFTFFYCAPYKCAKCDVKDTVTGQIWHSDVYRVYGSNVNNNGVVFMLESEDLNSANYRTGYIGRQQNTVTTVTTYQTPDAPSWIQRSFSSGQFAWWK